MHEVALLAAPVALLLLVMPLLHSISRCRHGRSSADIKLRRWWISCSAIFLASILSGLLLEFLGRVLFRIPPARHHLRHSAHCSVVSKGVDLRFARACLSGNLSPVSINLFGMPDALKFQCSLDYYWIALIEVELNSSIRFLSEIPSEALPRKCRPDFAKLWRTVESLEANRSYPCTYTEKSINSIGNSLSPLQDHCKPESPSTIKLLRDYLLLIGSSYNLKQPRSIGSYFWKAIYALAIGLSYSIVVSGITKASSWFQFKALDPGHRNFIDVVLFEARLQISFLIFTATAAMVLSTTRFEQLRLGFQLLGIDLRSKALARWLENTFF